MSLVRAQYLATCVLWKLCASDSPAVISILETTSLIPTLCQTVCGDGPITRSRIMSSRFLMFLRGHHKALVLRFLDETSGKNALEAYFLHGMAYYPLEGEEPEMQAYFHTSIAFLAVLSSEKPAKIVFSEAGLLNVLLNIISTSEDPGLVLCSLYIVLNLSTLPENQVQCLGVEPHSALTPPDAVVVVAVPVLLWLCACSR